MLPAPSKATRPVDPVKLIFLSEDKVAVELGTRPAATKRSKALTVMSR